MAHSNKEIISLAWCDNGLVDGKFAEGLVYTMVGAMNRNLPIGNAIRVQGNQIARQRDALMDRWYEEIKTDWLLWVDSDIVLTADILAMLWKVADKNTAPVVCGTYFVSKQMETPLMMPMPALFVESGDEFVIKALHPMPKNQVVNVDCAGLGLTLMHRSVVKKLRDKFGEDCFIFAEQTAKGSTEEFIGEDISFFRKVKAAGIPVLAHTGAIVKHMKRFALDDNYYNLYWAALAHAERVKEHEQSSEQA